MLLDLIDGSNNKCIINSLSKQHFFFFIEFLILIWFGIAILLAFTHFRILTCMNVNIYIKWSSSVQFFFIPSISLVNFYELI